ncbi:MAG: DUF3127 domain-containing protein [Cyclobacteriaceae bacterium]
MKVEGKLLAKMNEQQVTDSFKKREFVVEYAENPQYPELVKFEFIQDKCSELDSINIGDYVSLEFNLKGRKWTDPQGVDKYFNTLQAWRISKADGNSESRATDTGADVSGNLPF